jgi:hypothetical protein
MRRPPPAVAVKLDESRSGRAANSPAAAAEPTCTPPPAKKLAKDKSTKAVPLNDAIFVFSPCAVFSISLLPPLLLLLLLLLVKPSERSTVVAFT